MKLSKNLLLVSLASLLIGITAGYFVGYDIGYEKALKDNINSFDDCLDAGYPIQESDPAVCRTPDGKTFIDFHGPLKYA